MTSNATSKQTGSFDYKRYHRQMIVQSFGSESQDKLRRATVLVIGAGGLGSAVIPYLAGAGIGTLGIIDFDVVDITNLQRQILYREADIGKLKADQAAKVVATLNSDVMPVPINCKITAQNATEYIQSYDIIVDATDGFENKLLINEAAVHCGKRCVHAGVMRWGGQISVFAPPHTPCLRCLLPGDLSHMNPPQASSEGIIGPVAGVFGCMQAIEVIKLITGNGEPLLGKMLQFDFLTMHSITIKVSRTPGCPVCGKL